MELNSTQFKQPHQMSPDEFNLHPSAVFHGTWLPDNDVFDLRRRNPTGAGWGLNDWDVYEKVHLGTFRSAVDRMHETIRWDPKGTNGDVKPRPDHAIGTIHSFWQTPHNVALGGVMAASDDPNPEDMAHFMPGSMWYRNQNEDYPNLSFATDEPEDHLKSQADFVKEAIAQGKIKEVHPETLKRYKAGTLGKMRVTVENVVNLNSQLYYPHPTLKRNTLGAYENAGPSEQNVRGKKFFDIPDESQDYWESLRREEEENGGFHVYRNSRGRVEVHQHREEDCNGDW